MVLIHSWHWVFKILSFLSGKSNRGKRRTRLAICSKPLSPTPGFLLIRWLLESRKGLEASCQGTQPSDAGLELLASSLTSWNSVGLDAEVIPNSQVYMMKVYTMPPAPKFPKDRNQKFSRLSDTGGTGTEICQTGRGALYLFPYNLLSTCLHSGCPQVAPVGSKKVFHTHFMFLSSLTSLGNDLTSGGNWVKPQFPAGQIKMHVRA